MSELGFAGVPRLRALLDSGEMSAREVTAGLLERIERLDPTLHSVIQDNPQALEEAEAAQRSTGPLAGIPVLVTDNVDTAAPLRTTAGSLALRHGFGAGDAPLVRAIRAAGGVIL